LPQLRNPPALANVREPQFTTLPMFNDIKQPKNSHSPG
jgi:hypothetical protein